MTGTVVPFRRPKRSTSTVGTVAITLSVVDGEVVVGLDGFEVDLTPDQARELARDLAELASDAEVAK